MNRNHTFISETVLAGDRYESKLFSPSLDDFSRSAEKRADVERSTRQRSTSRKPAVAGRSTNERMLPTRLNFQNVEEIKVEHSPFVEVKREENRAQKVRFTDDNNGSTGAATTRKDEDVIQYLQRRDDVKETNFELCHASEIDREENMAEKLQSIESVTLVPHLPRDDNRCKQNGNELSSQSVEDIKLECSYLNKFDRDDNGCKIPNNHEDITRALHNGDELTLHSVEEVTLECSNFNGFDRKETKLTTVRCTDPVTLAAQSPTKDNSGFQISTAALKDEEITQDPQKEDGLCIRNLEDEGQISPVTFNGHPVLPEATQISGACNGTSLAMPILSDELLLPSIDDHSVADTENSINSKDDIEQTLKDTDENIMLERTSLPMLFLRMWVQSTIALFWFLLKLPWLMLVLSVKATALTAGLYAVLYVCFADDSLQSAPWTSNTQLYNKPGIR